MPATRLDCDGGRTRISVALAERGGWLLLVERGGQVVATEHYDDWHRVERRRQLLEAGTLPHVARVAAALLVLAAITAAPVAAQTPAPIFPESGIVKKAIGFVTERKGDDATGPKERFYPEFGHMITVPADAVQMVSALPRHGATHVETVRRGLEEWMEGHESRA